MNVHDLDEYLKKLLSIDEFASIDASQNGLQVDNGNLPVKKVAFAVDACVQTIMQAKARGANILFVHHGLFWSKSQLITDVHFKRLSALIKNDIALYAVHLPLDAHPLYGNNAVLAHQLNLSNIQPFGEYHGRFIGVAGSLTESHSLEDMVQALFPQGDTPSHILPFGPEQIKNIAIVSGAGSSCLAEAGNKDIELFITGEINHSLYHHAYELGISVIAGGHYYTETVGVQAVAKKLEQDTGIETLFIDVPTGI